MEAPIAVIDFGSQFTQLIVRRIRELGFFAKLYCPEDLARVGGVKLVVLSGGPRSVTDADAPDIDFDFLRGLKVPVLGVCYGMQLLNLKFGGDVKKSTTSEYGPSTLIPEGESQLTAGLSRESQIWMSHSDSVGNLHEGARVVGRNQEGQPVAIEWPDQFFGIQFHPEVSHSHEGLPLLKNFLSLATDLPPFEIGSFRDHLIETIREEVAGREVVCGVSGGVDSTVLAVLLKSAGVRVRPIFVDNGMLRKGEAEEVVNNFRELGIEIHKADAGKRFLEVLEGVTDPEEKRRRIGDLFVDVFFEFAGTLELLAQGTLYPDVIESATSGSNIASRIKTHHNRVDRILDLQKEGRVIEPLAELFKDEVRALGRSMGIPDVQLNRHPFPGPGLAVRVPGEVTEERLAIAREADAVFIQCLRDHGWYDKIWQAYAAVLPLRTVGVKGDERSYEFPVSLRAVVSEDAMTASWGQLPHELLADVSHKILNQVQGVNRVLYDISTKPPASIEWE